MNKEIEEIIEYFRNDIKWLEEELKNPHYLGYYITIRDKEYEYLKQLLDYITNLQEDNKRLNNEKDLFYKISEERLNKWLNLNDENNELVEIIKKYKARISKAIEYIEEKQIQNEYTDRCGFRVKENKWWLEDSDILLDILRGEDNGVR